MKSIYHFLVCCVVFTGMQSCTGANEADMTMKLYEFHRNYHLTPDTSLGTFTLNIEVELPEKFQNKEVLKNIQHQLIAKMFGEVYNSFPMDSVLSKYGELLHSEYLRINAPYIEQVKDLSKDATSIFENEIYIEGVAMYVDNKLLSYSYERFANMGGDYGGNNKLFYNYDLTTSLPLKESDIFVKNYEPSLIQLLKKQITADHANANSVNDLRELQYYEDRIRPNNNFYLTAEGLYYFFNTYEIDPHTTMQKSVLLTYEQLKPILKQNSPISYLYQNPIEYDE